MRNHKKIRLCNKADFENVDYLSAFEDNQTRNFDHCIDDYEGMVVTNNQDNSIGDSLLFKITKCDPLNSEGIICASPDEIKHKV